MYKTILCPLDGTEKTEPVLAHVKSMAVCYHATVILLIVEDPPILLGHDEVIGDPEYLIKRRKQHESYLSAIRNKFEAKHIPTKTMVKNGPLAAAIGEVAQRERVDLVAMTGRDSDGLLTASQGSAANSVVQSARCPLFFVGSGAVPD